MSGSMESTVGKQVATDDCNTDGVSRPPLFKDSEEAFEVQGVSTELLDIWTKREHKALSSTKGSSEQVPIQVRDTVHRFMQHLTLLAGLPPKAWFEAVTLLDIYYLKKKGGVPIEALPATYAAMVMILKKSDCALSAVNTCQVAPHAAQLAKWLQGLGFDGVASAVTDGMILDAETSVLEALEWRLNFPTVEGWTSAFCARLNILTQNLFKASLEWVWQQNLAIARLIMFKQACSTEVSPEKISVGLLGLGMVAAQVLPLDALRPSTLTSAAWERLYLDSWPQATIPQCALSTDQASCILNVLQAAVRWNLLQVQEACQSIATLMRDSLAEMKTGQQTAAGPQLQNTVL